MYAQRRHPANLNGCHSITNASHHRFQLPGTFGTGKSYISFATRQIGWQKALKPRHKVYLVDAALRNAVLLRGEEIQTNPEEIGTIVETTVHRHLRAYHYRETPEISYWRDSTTNKEVDIIVKSPAYTLPVEVKYREKAQLHANDGLVVYCDSENVKWAYMITKSDEDFGIHEFANVPTKFLKIPAHIFTYLLGQSERLLWKNVGGK